MSIEDKLTSIAENQEKVFEAGKAQDRSDFWDTYQDYGRQLNYKHMFANFFWTEERIKQYKYPLCPNGVQINGYMMFADNNNIVDLTKVLWRDKENVLYFSGAQYAFRNCSNLQRVGKMRCRNYIQNTFETCPMLAVIDELTIDSSSGISAFAAVPNLTYIKWAGEGCIGVDIDLSSATATTTIVVPEEVLDDSGNVEIAAGTEVTETGVMYNPTIKTLIPALKSGVYKKLTLGEINKAKLSEADIATITGKGWTIV